MRDLPHVIHLAGADGTGKTTQARAVMSWLERNGVPARYVWLRYPRYFCTPFLAYARLRGYSWYETIDGHRHGYWTFQDSWLMSRLFPWAVLLDALIVAVVGIYWPRSRGFTVVCDRFVGDMLADLMVGLQDLRFDERLPGRLFLRLLPPGSRLVVLDLDTAVARRRSPELNGDRSQPLRRQAYQHLAARRGYALVSSDAPVDVVTSRIIAVLTNGSETDLPPGRRMEDTAPARVAERVRLVEPAPAAHPAGNGQAPDEQT